MPRRTRRPVAVLLALLAAVVLVGASVTLVVRLAGGGDDGDSATPATPATTLPPPTSDPAETTLPPASGLSAEQARTVERLKVQVADIRGLQWKGELPIRIVGPDDLDKRLADLTAIEREKDTAELAALEDVLKLLQLIPRDLDFETAIDKLLAGGVLGFYDDEAKELFVGGDPDDDLDLATQSTMVHELVHALTDQHFDFGSRNRALGDEERAEESFALSALIEGDAELVRILWAEEHLTPRQRDEAESGGSGDPSVYLETPEYILDSLFFPYSAGLEFVTAIHDGGGFGAVDRAYREPPASTEDILHPDEFVPGRQFTRPPLPDLAAATGCTAVDTSVIGEFDMTQVLDQHLPAEEARRAAAGWNGDAYGLVRCGAAVGMVDRWRADSPDDLTELAESLGRWARRWSGSNRLPEADGRFSGPSGSGRIIRSGDRIDLVIADDASTSDRLVAALLAG